MLRNCCRTNHAKMGKSFRMKIKAGQIEISDINLKFEDGDFRAEGMLRGPNGFIFAAEILTETSKISNISDSNMQMGPALAV